jgi:hypothetical protein
VPARQIRYISNFDVTAKLVCSLSARCSKAADGIYAYIWTFFSKNNISLEDTVSIG